MYLHKLIIMPRRVLFLILTAELYFCTNAYDLPKVHLNDGIITGTYYQTVYGRKVYGFFGVPYAAPPIGDNRFEAPKSVKPWIGEWNATIPTSPCLQYAHSNYSILGEEDCLYLNIYTPQLPKDEGSKLLDVVVYFHGGCFMFGTGNIKKGDHLLKQNDIVFVSVNYRVGPLGFLSTGDAIIPGNFGLKDQNKALQWIKQNIAKFGGSPRVTISGMSAGGASVHYHFLSPMSEGLFQRGVSQSGSALVSWAQPKNVPEKSKRLASLLGCPTHCTKQMLKCLKTRPARRIVENVKEFMPWRYNPYSPFGPVVEPPGPNSFLSEKPIDIIRQGKVKNIPWLISVTEDEGLYPVADFLYDDQLMQEVDENWNSIAPHLMDYNHTVSSELIDSVSQQIREYFLRNEKISPSNYKSLTKVVGDRLFTAYIEFTIREQAKSNAGPIYYYKFNYRGKYSLSEFYAHNNNNYGVSHGDDLQYVVKVPYGHPHEETKDQKMVDFMLSLWLSYIYSGKPQVENITWVPVSKTTINDGIAYLQIDSPFNVKIQNTKDTSVFDFWNSLLNEYVIESKATPGDEL